MERINEILDFWFEDIDEDTLIESDCDLMIKWFGKNKEYDNFMRKNFEKDVKNASLDRYKDWEDSPEGRLALIILLDQFPRNIYRGKMAAFENDLKALELSFRSLKDGTIDKLRLVERIFVYMPLVHSENIEIQAMAVECFEKLAKRAEEEEDVNVELFNNSLDYAKRHYDAIDRFKRFPQRNKTLKRRSTSDEIAYLQNPNNLF